MVKEYTALLYKTGSSDSQPVPVKLERDKLYININGEYQVLLVPEAEITLGGENNSFLIIKNNDLILYIKESGFFDELINSANGELKARLLSLKKQHNTGKKEIKKTFLYFSGIFAAFILIVIISFNIFIAVVVNSIPVSWEEKIGDAAFGTIVSKDKIVTDEKLTKPIETLSKYLHEKSNNSEYNLKVHVVKDDQVNAFALPGGNIAVYTGLLEKSDSMEEVAGVLSHELNHVYQKHGIKRIAKRVGISVGFSMLFGDVSGVLYALGGDLLGLKFDRDEEREADRLGLELLYNSGIKPEGMVSFFEKLDEVNGDMPSAVSIISTHPPTDERIENMNKLINEKYNNLPYTKKFDFNWQEVKELAAKQ